MQNTIGKYKYSRAALFIWTALIFILGYLVAAMKVAA